MLKLVISPICRVEFMLEGSYMSVPVFGVVLAIHKYLGIL